MTRRQMLEKLRIPYKDKYSPVFFFINVPFTITIDVRWVKVAPYITLGKIQAIYGVQHTGSN